MAEVWVDVLPYNFTGPRHLKDAPVHPFIDERIAIGQPSRAADKELWNVQFGLSELCPVYSQTSCFVTGTISIISDPPVTCSSAAGYPAFISPDNGVTPAFQLANGMPTVEFPSSSDLTPGFGAVPVGTTPNTSITFFKRDRTTGYLYQSSLDVQHEISNNLVIDIGYLGTFEHHLSSMTPQSINQVPTDKLGPGNAQARRPFPQFSNVQILEPDIGASNYHGVNIGLQKRYSQGLQLQADYTFAKFIDNIDSMSELAGYPANVFTNYYDRRSDRGLSDNDVRNRLIVSTVYDLPFGYGRLIEPRNRVLGTALGGWTIGAIAEFHSGTPLSPFELTNNTGSFSDGVRPNITGATSLPGDRSKAAKVAQWFNTNAFAAPPAYTFGDAGRTFGTGPGATNLDASLLKDFRVGDRTVVQFRTEALNVINRANFANPNTSAMKPNLWPDHIVSFRKPGTNHPAWTAPCILEANRLPFVPNQRSLGKLQRHRATCSQACGSKC